MQSFNSILAKSFNKLNKRDGTVFRTRFRSVIVEDGEYIKELIRFIHLEPVHKGECSINKLNSYKWCSHGAFLGTVSNVFLNPQEVLKHFRGADPKKEYLEYIHSGKDHYHKEVTKNIKDANQGKLDFRKSELWIIGTPDFVKDTLERDKCRRTRIARYKKENMTFQILQKSITALLDLEDDALLKRGRFDVKSTARELFVYTGKYRYDYSGAQMADYLKTTESAISRMMTRFNKIDNKSYLIGRVLEKII